MATRYEIALLDQLGEQVAVITDWRRLEYTNVVNGVGQYKLIIDGDLPVVDDFALDGQIIISRYDLAASPTIPKYNDFSAFHRNEIRSTSENGMSTYESQGVSYDHLIRRRIINFRPGTSGADKSGAGETVMKAYVNENAGPDAVSPPRISGGVTQNLTIQADVAGGSAWEGTRGFKGLLDVLKEIADSTAVDFEVVAGSSPATFVFNAKARPIGTDRSVSNTAGNAPLVFSLDYANMIEPSYTLSRMAEINRSVVLGQGQPGTREVAVRSGAGVADSPWNLIEGTRGAGQEADTAALNVIGDAMLQALRARETFNFDVFQTESSKYGRDYFLGDIVTARYQNVQRDLQIVGVGITVEAGLGEEIRISVSDVS